VYYLHRDYLGSIVGISDSGGKVIEKRHYGAWGALEKYESSDTSLTAEHPMLDRGWTGHEYFADVHLVHMNGRMYDTDLRRFLSPDNYVQDPTNTQNYNRYQYGYNNPLKYSDPSGELFGLSILLSGLIIGALAGGVSYAVKAAVTGHWKWGGFLGSIAIGAVSGLYGGAAYKAMQGIVSVGGFLGGAIKGAVSGFVGGFIGGAGNAAMNGKNIVKGAFSGALTGAVVGGLLGGVSEGLYAMKHGGKFWNGDGMTVDVVNYYEIKDPKEIKVNNPIEATDENLAKYVKDKFPNADLDSITKYSVTDEGLNGNLGFAKTTATFDSSTNSWLVSGKSELRISPRVFLNSETLHATVGHELVHVSQYKALIGYQHIGGVESIGYKTLREAGAYDFEYRIGGYGAMQEFNESYGKLYLGAIRKYPGYKSIVSWRNFDWARKMVNLYKRFLR